MGILSDMRRKAVLANGGLAGDKVARGEAEIALQQASELRLVPSIRFAGMLPEGVQNWTVYAGALSPAARNKDSALALMSIFADPGIEPILSKRGTGSALTPFRRHLRPPSPQTGKASPFTFPPPRPRGGCPKGEGADGRRPNPS